MQKQKVVSEKAVLYGRDRIGIEMVIAFGTQAIYIPEKLVTKWDNLEVPPDPVWDELTYRRYNYGDLNGNIATFFISDDVDLDDFEEKWEFINTLISFFSKSMI